MPSFEETIEKIAGFAGGPGGAVASAAFTGVLGVAQMIQGNKQQKQADEMAASTVRPVYRTQQPILDNNAIAEQQASQGVTDATMMVYENNMDRTLTTSIDALLRGGGSVNNMADLYDTAEDNFSQVALLEEEVRRKGIQNYMSQNEKYAGELDKEFQINEWAPYRDRLQAIAQLREQGNANKWAGLNTIGGAFNNLATGQQLKEESDNVFGEQKKSPKTMYRPVNPILPKVNISTAPGSSVQDPFFIPSGSAADFYNYQNRPR